MPQFIKDLPLGLPDRIIDDSLPVVRNFTDQDRADGEKLLEHLGVPRHAVTLGMQASNEAKLDFLLMFDKTYKGHVPTIPTSFEGHRIRACRLEPVIIRQGW